MIINKKLNNIFSLSIYTPCYWYRDACTVCLCVVCMYVRVCVLVFETYSQDLPRMPSSELPSAFNRCTCVCRRFAKAAKHDSSPQWHCPISPLYIRCLPIQPLWLILCTCLLYVSQSWLKVSILYHTTSCTNLGVAGACGRFLQSFGCKWMKALSSLQQVHGSHDCPAFKKRTCVTFNLLT